MTTANGHKAATPVDVLARADSRWATRRGDDPAPREYLEHLAKYLEPVLPASKADAQPSISDDELADLRERLAAAEQLAAGRGATVDQLTAELANARADRPLMSKVDGLTAELDKATTDNRALTQQVGQLRADYDSATADTSQLAELYEQIVRERDQLAAQVAVVQAHVCAWEWPDPNKRLEPCECGRPYPRYALEELTEPVKPDPEDWGPIFARIRAELKGGVARG